MLVVAMSDNIVVKVDNLSKSFDVYKNAQDLLMEFVTGKVRHDVFWALRNVSFEIYEKQRIGIIGPNGAGKSTLLKILTGNLNETTGSVQVNGKISALLSMASSLNPEESGIDNIRFNLLVNGVPQNIIPDLVDDIVEFAEIGSFIYSPVKTYSSGMNARLSFGIATAMEPEILVVDEVLSVGDGYFLGKAYERMMRLVERGKALIFVSHSVAEVRKLCNTALWIENGTVRMIGEAGYVCTQYEEDYQHNQAIQQKEKNRVKYQKQAIENVSVEHLQKYGFIIRIVSINTDKRFKDVHYIKNIMIKTRGKEFMDVELEPDVTEPKLYSLDLLGSEWGRIYDRQGVKTRSLSYQTGKMRGGIILCKYDCVEDNDDSYEVELCFESANITKQETLEIDVFDPKTQQWRNIHCNHDEMEAGWRRYSCTFSVTRTIDAEIKSLVDTYQSRPVKAAELLSANIIVAGKSSVTVMERQSFEIVIKFRVNQIIDLLDVHLVLFRSDGVYVLWQPAGLNDRHVHSALGYYEARYLVDPNILGAGHYYVNATLKDGWDINKHYNDYEIFDNALHLCEFMVEKEYKVEMVDFGIVNMRVNVTISPLSDESAQQEDTTISINAE